jgi:hypothetical protein
LDVRISTDPGEELSSLQDWLAHEPELRAQVRPVRPPPVDGQLGAATEVLAVAVGTGGAMSVLAASLKSWLSQPRRADVRVTILAPDGRLIEVDAKRVENVEAVLRATLPPTERH